MQLHAKGREAVKGYLFISLFIVGFVFFFLVPCIQSILYSFSDLNAQSNYKIVLSGLKHYKRAFLEDAEFNRLIVSAVSNMALNVPIIAIFSFFIASMLKNNFPGRNGIRIIFFLPVILMSGIIPTMESGDLAQKLMMQSSSSELLISGTQIEGFLESLNIGGTLSQYILTAVQSVFSIVSNSGIQILICLTALQSISPSLYEASSIEGATGWENFWKITFPMVTPQLLVCVVYTIIDSFANVNNVAMQYIYDFTFNKFQFSYGAALSWSYFGVIILALLLFGGVLSRFVVKYDR